MATLVRFSGEILSDWFDFLKSRDNWIAKFERNADRMSAAFARCGFYDPSLPNGGPRARRETDDDEIELRYDRDDPTNGVRQITTGFKKWAERYIADCSGHRRYQHQLARMDKWNEALQAHLDRHYLA